MQDHCFFSAKKYNDMWLLLRIIIEQLINIHRYIDIYLYTFRYLALQNITVLCGQNFVYRTSLRGQPGSVLTLDTIATPHSYL